MKKYNFFQAFYMSFYSKDLYRDVAKNWGGGVVFYLFLVLLICWIAMMFRYQPIINTTFRHLINEITPQVPKMSIQNGVVKTPENKPYYIKEPKKDEVIGIIDTSGKYADMDNVPTNTLFLLTKNKIYYKDNQNAIRENTIAPTINMNVIPDTVKNVAIKFVKVILYSDLLFILEL